MGPFGTEAEVLELPAVRVIYDASRASSRLGVLGELGYQMLIGACVEADARLGAYDRRILLWLAGFGSQTCAVVAGLIGRAHAAVPAAARQHTCPVREAASRA